MKFALSCGKHVLWKAAQCGQVNIAYSIIVTGALGAPSAISTISCFSCASARRAGPRRQRRRGRAARVWRRVRVMGSAFRFICGFGYGIAHSAPMSPRPRAGRDHQCLKAARERAEIARRTRPGARPARRRGLGEALRRVGELDPPTVSGPSAALTRSRRIGSSICSCGACGPRDRERQQPARRPARQRELRRPRRSPRTPARRSRPRARAAAPGRSRASPRRCGAAAGSGRRRG